LLYRIPFDSTAEERVAVTAWCLENGWPEPEIEGTGSAYFHEIVSTRLIELEAANADGSGAPLLAP
jgi:hypothetical protein